MLFIIVNRLVRAWPNESDHYPSLSEFKVVGQATATELVVDSADNVRSWLRASSTRVFERAMGADSPASEVTFRFSEHERFADCRGRLPARSCVCESPKRVGEHGFGIDLRVAQASAIPRTWAHSDGPMYNLAIRAFDAGGKADTVTMSIRVTDKNWPPTIQRLH